MSVKYKVIKKAENTGVATVPVRQPSLRAQKAVSILAENGGKKGDALREAGYSESIALYPSKVFESVNVKPLLDPIVEKMKKERDAIITLMAKKRKTANYAVLSMAMRNMNHDIQVLSGRPTEIVDKPLETEEEMFLRAILSRNS